LNQCRLHKTKKHTQWKKEQDPRIPRTLKVRGAPPLPSLVASHAAPGVVDILELACNAARDNKKSHIIQLHVRVRRAHRQTTQHGRPEWRGRRRGCCCGTRYVPRGAGLCVGVFAVCQLVCSCCTDVPISGTTTHTQSQRRGSVSEAPAHVSVWKATADVDVGGAQPHVFTLLLQTEGCARLVWARASRQRAISTSD
jgi:hypothetical protein